MRTLLAPASESDPKNEPVVKLRQRKGEEALASGGLVHNSRDPGRLSSGREVLCERGR